jgi:protein-S-isoprenylcysteine O-methyltransferase Ste14
MSTNILHQAVTLAASGYSMSVLSMFYGWLVDIRRHYPNLVPALQILNGVDDGLTVSSNPILNNVSLLLLLFVQHLGMATTTYKNRVFPKIFGASNIWLQRPLYNVTSAACLHFLMSRWVPMPKIVVRGFGIPYEAIIGIHLAALTLTSTSLLSIGLSDFFSSERDYVEKQVTMSGPYRYIRHPMMTALFTMLWVVPEPGITEGRLLLSSAMSIFMHLAVKFHEEPTMHEELGPAYSNYCNLVRSRYIPC